MIGVAEAARAHRDAEEALSGFHNRDVDAQVPVEELDKAIEALDRAQGMLERQEAVLRTQRKEILGGVLS